MIKFNLAKLENHLAFQILDISNGYVNSIGIGNHILYISEFSHIHLSASNMDLRGSSHKIHYPSKGTAHILMFFNNSDRNTAYDIILNTLKND